MALNMNDARNLRDLLDSKGWLLVMERLSRVYDDELRKLRRAERIDEFHKVQGSLDMLERLLRVPTELLRECRPTPE